MDEKRKRKSYFKSVFVGLFILLVAISLLLVKFATPSLYINPTAEYLQNHPIPTPEYLLEHFNSMGNDCLAFGMEPFWTSDFDGYAENIIFATAVLYIDNVLVPKDTISFMDLEVGHSVIQNNEVVGVYGGPINICLDLSPYENGLHLGRIEFSVNGQDYAYEWVILVDKDGEDSSNRLATPIMFATLTEIP